MYPVPISIWGYNFTCLESAYQARKVNQLKLFQPLNGYAAKKLNKKFPMRGNWNTSKESVMLDLLIEKFTQPNLTHLLLETGDAELIEGNTWGDTYWGVCNGKGQNKLGNLLMDLRQNLREI